MLTSSTSYRKYRDDLVVVRRAKRPASRPTLPGTRVCVRGGAFGGMTGILLRQPPDRPALVRVEVLGRPVDLEVEPSRLTRC